MEHWKIPGTVAYVTFNHVISTIHECRNMSEVAKRLGVGRSTLYRWLGEWSIDENAIDVLMEAKRRKLENRCGVTLKASEKSKGGARRQAYSIVYGSDQPIASVRRVKKRTRLEDVRGTLELVVIDEPSITIVPENYIRSDAVWGFGVPNPEPFMFRKAG